MGSTNKTQYLELPQWIGTDKPTFLGDFNDAFLKIDNGYNTINGTATTAGAQAGQAVEDASEALTKVKAVEGTANTANSTANQANNTATQALETANNAQSAVNSLSGKVSGNTANIDNIKTWITGNITNMFAGGVGFSNYNADLNLLNIVLYTNNPQSINVNQVIGKLPNQIMTALNITENRTLYAIANFTLQSGDAFNGNVILTPEGNVEAQNSINISRGGINAMLCVVDWD